MLTQWNRRESGPLAERNDHGDRTMAEEETHLTRTQARAGSSNHMLRYILPASMALVVILFVVIVWLWH
jgi:hypothetical protein